MKRAKYSPRENEHRGEKSIRQEWLTKVFGEEYLLIWNGYNHFAVNKETGENFYIFKKRGFLLTEKLYAHYSMWRKRADQYYYHQGFEKLGVECKVLEEK